MPLPFRRKPEQSRMPTAHSLEEAANSDNSLEGYVAVNHGAGPHQEHQPDDHDLIAELAYQFYLDRNGQSGSAEEDWYRAERELRHRREEGNPDRPTIPGDAMNL